MRLYLISFVGFVTFTGLYRQLLCINLLSERQIKESCSLTSFYFSWLNSPFCSWNSWKLCHCRLFPPIIPMSSIFLFIWPLLSGIRDQHFLAPLNSHQRATCIPSINFSVEISSDVIIFFFHSWVLKHISIIIFVHTF